MQSLFMASIIGVEWILIGYSMSFGPDVGGLVGDLSWLGLSGVGAEPNPDYAATIPQSAFMLYQCMFAIITPALITGAFAERVRFAPFVVFSLLWAVFVYNPVCHWIWGNGGWLKARGVLDFAGGLVVHLTCGVAALITALMIGARKGYGKQSFAPHNLPMTLLGTGLLWFGWFGFNGGSALAADGIAAGAAVATHIAGLVAMATWLAVEWTHRGKPTTLGAASGAIAGLATITPAAGFVSPMAAIFIGILAGIVCYAAVIFKGRLGYDDSLDVIGIHGIGGLTGTVCLGLFASRAINPGGADGLFSGNPGFFITQLYGIFAVLVYTLVVTWIIVKVIDMTMGLRVAPEAETEGLDLSEHSETAYAN